MSYSQFIKHLTNHIEIKIWVKPNSSQKGILGCNESGIILAVQAPPVEGKANQAIIETMSKLIGIPKSQLEIIKGHKTRIKVIKMPSNDKTLTFLNHQFNFY